ncbi:Spo11/DNA topoisomerase VI subunit A [Hyaloraphidium curvatum]|nr:Spo11/DNA topoisomerase VI subunit A [Hyaloraphidium curvatum]
MAIVQELLRKDATCTKRDLFYKDVALFKNQRTSDKAIEDLAKALAVPRSALHVHASSRGLVAGGLTIELKNGSVSCVSANDQGVLVPPPEDVIGVELEDNVHVVLLVEKEASFRHLVPRCPSSILLVTGKGYPDASTRNLLRMIERRIEDDESEVQLLALVDCDPWGMDIYLNTKQGPKNKPDEGIGSLELLGLMCDDLSRYSIGHNRLLPLSAADIKKGHRILELFLSNEGPDADVAQEIQTMLWMGAKAELQVLADTGRDRAAPEPGGDWMADVWLKEKLQRLDLA